MAVIAITVAIGIGRVDRFELTTAGILHGRKLVPWTAVTPVVAGGKPGAATVRLFYGRNLRPGLTSMVELSSVPSMTLVDYRAITDRLRAEVLPEHPHLQLGGLEPIRMLDAS